MKAGLRIALGIAAAIAVVVAGLGAVWTLWGRNLWVPGVMGEGTPGDRGTKEGYPSYSDSIPTREQIQEALEGYVRNLDHDALEIADVVEFEHNFYATVRERDTGMCAMELLVNKASGDVVPEMGPNMMWNARYGMHRRGAMMMGRSSETNALSAGQALEMAQRWLDVNRPGITAGQHPDTFYGYYTIRTIENGQIAGLLSVHGTTGQIWEHTWHGDFVRTIESSQDHD